MPRGWGERGRKGEGRLKSRVSLGSVYLSRVLLCVASPRVGNYRFYFHLKVTGFEAFIELLRLCLFSSRSPRKRVMMMPVCYCKRFRNAFQQGQHSSIHIGFFFWWVGTGCDVIMIKISSFSLLNRGPSPFHRRALEEEGPIYLPFV